MIGLFRRADKPTLADAAALGQTMLALPLPATCAVPAGCVGLVVDQGSPQSLLARYGRENMDDVFLDIARERVLPDHGSSADGHGEGMRS